MDEMLLLDKNKGLGISSFRVISLCNSRKGVLVSASYASYLLVLLYNLRNLFIFCINVDIEEILLLDKNNSTGINSFIVIYLCNS